MKRSKFLGLLAALVSLPLWGKRKKPIETVMAIGKDNNLVPFEVNTRAPQYPRADSEVHVGILKPGTIVEIPIMMDLYCFVIQDYDPGIKKYKVGWTSGGRGSFWTTRDQIKRVVSIPDDSF